NRPRGAGVDPEPDPVAEPQGGLPHRIGQYDLVLALEFADRLVVRRQAHRAAETKGCGCFMTPPRASRLTGCRPSWKGARTVSGPKVLNKCGFQQSPHTRSCPAPWIRAGPRRSKEIGRAHV